MLDACDDLQQCEADQYLSIPASETDCWNICGVNSVESGAGSASEYQCLACNDSCASCYGPASTQCYSCDSYYITLQQAGTLIESIVCEDGTIRNTTLDVRNCVSECPSGFFSSGMECVCPTGYYLNASTISCSECSSGCSVCANGTQTGCLQCSVVEHQGQCLEGCPSDLINVNGRCEEASNEEL